MGRAHGALNKGVMKRNKGLVLLLQIFELFFNELLLLLFVLIHYKCLVLQAGELHRGLV